MSTPAAAVLNDAGAAAGSPAAGTPGAPVLPPGAPGTATVPAGFWDSWKAPEQKEVRDWVANKAYADPFVLAKTARDLDREAGTLRQLKGYPADAIGADGTVPKEQEGRVSAWSTAMGVPETADKYDIPLPANNPFPEFKNFMAEELRLARVPAAMAPALARGYERAVQKMEAKLKEAENTQSQIQLAELQHAWGSNYQERIAYAARGKAWMANELGGLTDDQMRSMESILSTPKFLTMMWKIGAGNKEAAFAGGSGDPKGFTGGASEAQQRWDQMQADRSAGKITDFQWRAMEPEREALIKQITAGNAQAN